MMESRSFSNIKYRLVDDSETIADNLDTLSDNDNNDNQNTNNKLRTPQENEPATLYPEPNNKELDDNSEKNDNYAENDNYTENTDVHESLYESAIEACLGNK